ncbi:MAG: M48 family metalloprotease [Thermodesulfobacteriota bacterium]
MVYENLIFFLVVIVVYSTKVATDPPQVTAAAAAGLFAAKALAFWLLAHRVFRDVRRAAGYFAAQQRLSILAVVLFVVDIYLLGGKYFLAHLPLARQVPVLLNLAGIALYFFYLAMLWLAAGGGYRRLFGGRQTRIGFLKSQVRTNLPVVLPWLILSGLFDLLHLTSIPYLNRIAASRWGEPLALLLFFLLLAVLLPALVHRLWGCTPLPDGPVRRQMEAFCRAQKLQVAGILLWPLFEGQALSAAVMGLTGRFRYILITPGLLRVLTPEELEAVLAHEIGHVKHRHLPLYLVFFMGFGLLAHLAADPLTYLAVSSDLFLGLFRIIRPSYENLDLLTSVPLFLALVLYFRYVFGFFMRNFERQADLFAIKATGTGRPLGQALDRIALLSGDIRDLPSWHHFGIGERVRFLEACEDDPHRIRRHDRKVRHMLLGYLLVMTGLSALAWQMPVDTLAHEADGRFAEAVVTSRLEADPRNETWPRLLGDLRAERGQYGPALAAYEQALALASDHPETLNNLAWLLVTAEDPGIRDPARGLTLARKAAQLRPTGYILDTLAHAQWATGDTRGALATERQAIAQDPEKLDYYRRQMERFVAPAKLPPLDQLEGWTP